MTGKASKSYRHFVQILWHGFYPWDVRLEKFIRVIRSMGFQVGVIGRNVNAAPNCEYIDDCKVQRIGEGDSLWNKALNYPLFLNPIFIYKVNRLLKRNRPSLLIVRDLPLGMLAIYFRYRYKIPLIFDMAENYPAALIAYENPIYKPFLILNALLPRIYENFVLKYSDAVIVVAEEQIERIAAKGIDPNRIHLVLNTPEEEFLTTPDISTEGNLQETNHFKPSILYIGKIDIHRGIKSLILAFSLILKKIPDAGLILVGDGKQKESLERLVIQMKLDQNIRFSGWINHNEIPNYIKKADICCIPHLKSEHTDTTVPNKLFDYMAFGKPVLASNLTPVEGIIKKIGCGRIFKSGNVDSISEQIIKLIENNEYKQIGSRGISAVKERYAWNHDARILKSTILRILSLN